MPGLFAFLHPAGVPAAGVALLRLATALLLLVLCDLSPDGGLLLAISTWACAAALLAGFLTRGVAFAASVWTLYGLLNGYAPDPASAGLLATGCLGAMSLALTGAGAFSVDAHLFGRRVIELDR